MCHIGKFDVDTCKRVVEIVKGLTVHKNDNGTI